ncbi:MAG: hypothetical protein ABIW19_14595 [Vicinamibacterales bacterium]
MSGLKYDAVLFEKALNHYHERPAELSDEELAQLTYVQPTLGERARAKRHGLVEAPDPEPGLKKLVTAGDLVQFMADVITPLLATYRVRVQEERVRVGELEARIKQLEVRPAVKYCGIHVEGGAYSEGNLATRTGALWLATQATSGTPGHPASGWRLVVKGGRDGKVTP